MYYAKYYGKGGTAAGGRGWVKNEDAGQNMKKAEGKSASDMG